VSAPDQGTEATLWLPVSEADSQATQTD